MQSEILHRLLAHLPLADARLLADKEATPEIRTEEEEALRQPDHPMDLFRRLRSTRSSRHRLAACLPGQTGDFTREVS